MQVSLNKTIERLVIWIDCGMHAREWISISSCMYILDKLTSDDDIAMDILQKYDVYMMPVVNPDGYVYSRLNVIWNFILIAVFIINIFFQNTEKAILLTCKWQIISIQDRSKNDNCQLKMQWIICYTTVVNLIFDEFNIFAFQSPIF